MATADVVACYQVLTEILPFGSAHDGVITSHILAGNRPPRPQNARWLRHQIWNTITTCWSDKRELRWDIHAVHHQLSASSIQETAEVEREHRRSPQAAIHTEDVIPFPFPEILATAPNFTPLRIRLPLWFIRIHPCSRLLLITLSLLLILIPVVLSLGPDPLLIIIIFLLLLILLLLPRSGGGFLSLRKPVGS